MLKQWIWKWYGWIMLQLSHSFLLNEIGTIGFSKIEIWFRLKNISFSPCPSLVLLGSNLAQATKRLAYRTSFCGVEKWVADELNQLISLNSTQKYYFFKRNMSQTQFQLQMIFYIIEYIFKHISQIRYWKLYFSSKSREEARTMCQQPNIDLVHAATSLKANSNNPHSQQSQYI